MTNLYNTLRTSLIETIREKGIKNEKVLEALSKIPRHEFVDKALAGDAYKDNALPIGNGQTISQPYIVALMTEALKLGKDDKILEIGTGSGFQAAMLAHFSKRVFTVERNRQLGERAKRILESLNYHNICFKIGDGSMGWPSYAPFDRIIVTAGGKEVPESLLKQLKDGGRMVIPVGDRGIQSLLVVDKKDGKITQKNICDVVFVPLVGKQGW